MTWRERLDAAWAPVMRWYGEHSERDRLIIAGVAVLVVLGGAYLAVVVPLRDRRARVAEEIEQGLTRIEHAERLVDSLKALELERGDLRQRLKAARGRLLPGGSETLGAAALQDRANELATRHGVTVRTTQVLRSEPSDPYRKVAVRLTLSGPLPGVSAMLTGLEFEHELMIPFLELSRRGVAGRAEGPASLTATMEVAGFVSSEDEAAADTELADVLPDDQPGPPLPPESGEHFVGPPRPTMVNEEAAS